MARNFLGKGGKDSGAEDGRGGHVDSAFSVGSAVQWSLSKEDSAMQQCTPFKTWQEEKTRNVMFDQISSTAFQPISTGAFFTNSKPCTLKAPQISIGVDKHSVQRFSVHNYQNQGVDEYRDSIPVGVSSPFFKIHGCSSGPNLTGTVVKPQPFLSVVANNNSLLGAGVGSFTPRNVVKPLPTTAQLTIFYAGSVNVYDDVPWDKAQEVMLMANEGLKATANAEAPALPLTKGSLSYDLRVAQIPKASNPCSGLSSTLSLASHEGNKTESGSIPTSDKAGPKRIGTPASTSQDDFSKATSTSIVAATAATILKRDCLVNKRSLDGAVPQARKASLARFLEKRKERVNNTMPYSFDQKPSKNLIVHEVAAPSSNCLVSRDSLTSNQNFSWFKGEAKNCDDNRNPPCTKLEM